MNRTSQLEDLNQPGLIATLLAPDNAAMNDLFNKLGELQCRAYCPAYGPRVLMVVKSNSIRCGKCVRLGATNLMLHESVALGSARTHVWHGLQLVVSNRYMW